MSIEKTLDELKSLQENLLDYLENEENDDENFQYLIKIFEDIKIRYDQHKLNLFLHLLSKIFNNHHRTHNFFIKFERILKHFQDDIKKYFTNSEIFNIFKGNKRFLLLLIEGKILNVDRYVVMKLILYKNRLSNCHLYFIPEIKPFINEIWFPKHYIDKYNRHINNWVDELKTEITSNFYELRNLGENDSYLGNLIQKDLVEEFIAYVNKENIFIKKEKIKLSIYETNSFLAKRQNVTLIEYAAFFGSIQIFNYLKNEGVELMPSLWIYTIYSNNPHLIHILEENHVIPNDQTYRECFKKAIKCHHNPIANYILDNLMNTDEMESKNSLIKSLKYYNIEFIRQKLMDNDIFYFFCKYDYCLFAESFLASRDIDINLKSILNQ